jgi:hypothetical protein
VPSMPLSFGGSAVHTTASRCRPAAHTAVAAAPEACRGGLPGHRPIECGTGPLRRRAAAGCAKAPLQRAQSTTRRSWRHADAICFLSNRGRHATVEELCEWAGGGAAQMGVPWALRTALHATRAAAPSVGPRRGLCALLHRTDRPMSSLYRIAIVTRANMRRSPQNQRPKRAWPLVGARRPVRAVAGPSARSSTQQHPWRCADAGQGD